MPTLIPGGGAAERLLTTSEVAAMFRVEPKTVTRWAQNKKLSFTRTLGGHRRFKEAEVLALLAEQNKDRIAS